MQKALKIIIICLSLIWVGLILGISFLEAPLKFQAPGITLPLGLGIGKLVFGALVKIELGITLFLIASFLVLKDKHSACLLFVIPFIIVLLDNFFLMPILDERIDIILEGGTPPPSSAHMWYIILEVMKLLSLMIAAIYFLKNHIKN